MTKLTTERLEKIRHAASDPRRLFYSSFRGGDIQFLLDLIESQKTDLQKCKAALERIVKYDGQEPMDFCKAYDEGFECGAYPIAKEALQSLSPSL